jgi:hypothetical protein
MLEVKGWVKYAEEDIFSDGCIIGTGYSTSGDLSFSAETEETLIDSLVSFVGADKSSVELNACDEPGRVDICLLENADGFAASKRQIEAWKLGHERLWYCTYIFQAHKVERSEFEFG